MKGNSGLVPEMLICPPILDNSPVAIYFPSPDSVSKMQIKYIFHRFQTEKEHKIDCICKCYASSKKQIK